MQIPSDAKVLVIDDFRFMANTVRRLLSQIGVKNVHDVADGIEALDRLRTGRYDLAICDLVLNCPDGLDVLRAVRTEAALAGLPFVIYTLDRSPGTLTTIRSAGASGWLYKPFGVPELRAVLEAVFETHRSAASSEAAQPTASDTLAVAVRFHPADQAFEQEPSRI